MTLENSNEDVSSVRLGIRDDRLNILMDLFNTSSDYFEYNLLAEVIFKVHCYRANQKVEDTNG